MLPWDQKGYWATRVATNLTEPGAGRRQRIAAIVVGGPDYGHHTLTRFFALHAGVLPALLVVFLVLHVALFRRHGICHKEPAKRPETTFWPEQVLRDAVACLAVLAVVLLLCDSFQRARLGARRIVAGNMPEQSWGRRPIRRRRTPPRGRNGISCFCFNFSNCSKAWRRTGERLGAIVTPGAWRCLMLFLMPLVGRWKWGHRFNIGFTIGCCCLGIAMLTGAAVSG